MTDSHKISSDGRFIWHDLMTPDVENAIAFYTKVFDWEIRKADMGADMIYQTFVVKDRARGGFVPMDDASHGAHWISYIGATDVDKVVTRCSDKGGSVTVPPFEVEGAGRLAVLSDPFGAVFSPFAPTVETDAEDPVFAWHQLNTPRPRSSRDFYSAVFGWQYSEDDLGKLGKYWTVMNAGIPVGGMMKMPPGVKGPAHWLPYIAAIADDAATAIQAYGGKLWVEPKDLPQNGGRFAVAADPTGAAFGVFERPPKPHRP